MPQAINQQLLNVAYKKSVSLLKEASTPYGILASLNDKENYKRIWARDGVISGLAGLLTNEDSLISALKHTLLTLEKCKGPQGQVPSNIKLNSDGKIEDISYGRIAGRVDTIPLFIIGICNYAKFTNDNNFADELRLSMKNSLDLLTAWEFNNRGFVYVPRSGDWADEYILEGYILYDQLLRLWALRCFISFFDDDSLKEKEQLLSESIMVNYWLQKKNLNSDKVYHKNAFESYLKKNNGLNYSLPALTPSGYITKFDALSNSLLILLNLAEDKQCDKILNYGQKIIMNNPCKMVPAFWPPITENDSEWNLLKANYSHSFKNKPYHYHNGGVWPMVNGFWGMALNRAGRTAKAENLLNSIVDFVKRGKGNTEWTYYEYADSLEGIPGGTAQLTWSAAGLILLKKSLEGKELFYG